MWSLQGKPASGKVNALNTSEEVAKMPRFAD
jgi:hypothetical protein